MPTLLPLWRFARRVSSAASRLPGSTRHRFALHGAQRWLARLWQAMEDDGVDYLSPVGGRWGGICGSAEVAGQWADDLVSTLRSCWTDPNPGSHFCCTTACLSCLLVAGRQQELLDLLELERRSWWHYRRYGVEALLALGKKAEVIQYVEASRGLNEPDSMIDQARVSGSPRPRISSAMIWRWNLRTGAPVIRKH